MLGKYLSRHRRSLPVRWFINKCTRAIHRHENIDNWDPVDNGEKLVLERLGNEGLTCVLDVGANVGDWVRMARKALPGATIHCFEVSETTFRELQSSLELVDNIVLNNRGLLDREGEVPLQHFPEYSALTTTLVDAGHPFDSVRAHGRVTTGDRYMKEAGLGHIDYVKIDVEGADHQVLFGFDDAIRGGRVDAFQFEYGEASIVTKFLLSDFYDFFTERGFTVGKIYPDGVVFRPYDRAHERFGGSNHVAVRNVKKDWIRLLADS